MWTEASSLREAQIFQYLTKCPKYFLFTVQTESQRVRSPKQLTQNGGEIVQDSPKIAQPKKFTL